ncbi:MAG: hypothetical protein JWR52_2763 [Marmoricola sp.]|nr:hypothetical protein [Marmoricola sp.]
MAPSSILAVVDVATGHYLHWGVIQISLTNLIVIVVMVVVFVLALLLPFPGGHDDGGDQ